MCVAGDMSFKYTLSGSRGNIRQTVSGKPETQLSVEVHLTGGRVCVCVCVCVCVWCCVCVCVESSGCFHPMCASVFMLQAYLPVCAFVCLCGYTGGNG